MGRKSFVAVVGDVVVARGRTPHATVRAAVTALLAAYSVRGNDVERGFQAPVEVREVAGREYDAAPHRMDDLYAAATAALVALGAAASGLPVGEAVH